MNPQFWLCSSLATGFISPWFKVARVWQRR